MLIPLTFKNNDTTSVKTKIGKITPQSARMMYSNSFSKEVGIIENYKKDNETESCSIASTETIGNNTRITFNKGAVIIYGGIGVIEQGTIFDIPRTTDIVNGSLGIKIDLSKSAGSEMEFYYKSSQTLQQDNILLNEQTGIYELELYKFSISGGVFSLGDRNANQIVETNESKFNELNNRTNIDYVIEEKVSEDKKTWYRIWASGLKECYINYTSPSGSTNQYITVTLDLPVTFETTNYAVFANSVSGRLSGNVDDVGWLSALTNVITNRNTDNVQFLSLYNKTTTVYCIGF